ncbi:MAG: OsmC family peroxiredoxin [Roseovarius sp.]|nr:OsmC family peroxiredoxin [Roseovarius sp.]
MERSASPKKQDDLKDGKGTSSTQSGMLKDNANGLDKRFKDISSATPEGLMGAAYAGAYAMTMSKLLAEKGLTAKQIDAKAQVTLDEAVGGLAVTHVHLVVTARVPGISDADFQQVAETTRKNTPISKTSNAEITLDAKLAS